ncbi:hypothetical protein Amsp01_080200 [Amycolatopsis sp. NBRC 101858]|nr:hypothetical protein Amsp01_080200 [Amycolatopsis sp. NBRC 101858]
MLCGSEEMRPGQTCDRTQYGQTTSETYEQKRQDSIDTANTFKNGGRWVTFGIGAGIGALCGWRLVVAVRRRAGPAQQPGFAPPPGYAPQGFPQQQPGFAPPQGFRQPPPPGYQPPRGPYQQ